MNKGGRNNLAIQKKPQEVMNKRRGLESQKKNC